MRCSFIWLIQKEKMMSNQITTAFVNHYSDTIQNLLQQKGSKLAPYVMQKSYTGKAAKCVEQIGQVSAQKRTSRHSDTPLISTPHDARWIFPSDYEWADLIDEEDKLRMITNPTSEYARNGAYALGRAQDDEIIKALFGDAKTGENGSTVTSFDTANQQVAAGSSGLTVEKLREAKKILLSNEVDVDEEFICVVTAEQMDNLLAATEVSSSDFNNVKALVQGQVDTFMGFKFVHSQRLGLDGSGNRRIPAYVTSGIGLGTWNDITTRIDVMPGKSYSTQVYVKGTFGATRVEEGKVVEILCSES